MVYKAGKEYVAENMCKKMDKDVLGRRELGK